MNHNYGGPNGPNSVTAGAQPVDPETAKRERAELRAAATPGVSINSEDGSFSFAGPIGKGYSPQSSHAEAERITPGSGHRVSGRSPEGLPQSPAEWTEDTVLTIGSVQGPISGPGGWLATGHVIKTADGYELASGVGGLE